MGDLGQREHPKNYGRIGVGSGAQKPAIAPGKRCMIGPSQGYYALSIGTKINDLG